MVESVRPMMLGTGKGKVVLDKGKEVVGIEGENLLGFLDGKIEFDIESYQPESDESRDVSLDDSDYDEDWEWTQVLPAESLVDVGVHTPDPEFSNFENGEASNAPLNAVQLCFLTLKMKMVILLT